MRCYAAPTFWRTAVPLEHHDRNREGAQRVECLPMEANGYPLTFQHGARRLDGGGRPSFIVLPMLLRSGATVGHRLARLAAWVGRAVGCCCGSRTGERSATIPPSSRHCSIF